LVVARRVMNINVILPTYFKLCSKIKINSGQKLLMVRYNMYLRRWL
jgi:hypothetical protein